MDRERAQQKLISWDRDELFYREYWQRVKEGRETSDLLQNSDVSQDWKNWVCDPSCIDPEITEKNFFREGRNISIKKHPRYFPYFEHHHSFFEMICVLSGSCREVTDGNGLILKKGDIYLLAPNVTHGIEVTDESVVVNVLIRHSTFMDIFLNTVRDKSQIALFFLGNLYEKDRIPYLLYHTGDDERIRGYLLDMIIEQMREDDFADKISCSLLTIFFYQLTRQYAATMETAGTVREKPAYREEMLSYIMANYQTITLKELAGAMHFSVPYCSRLVLEITGYSFSDLVTQVRLQQGENLLSHTQMNVGDISFRIGYKNPETFIRAFTRAYRMTPSQYRKSVLLAAKQA